MGLSDAVKSDERTALEALRDHLTAALEDAEPRYKSPLAKQLREVLADLKQLAPAEESKTDDLAAQRARRRANASKRSA